MGRVATIIVVFYSILVVLSILLVFVVWRSTRARRSADPDLLARREKSWFAVVVLLLASLLFATIFFTPYGKSAPTQKQIVHVQGFQFGWLIQPAAMKANVPVEFQLRSLDVNHAFAVYNPHNVLLFQIQVVPGRTQKLVYTFKKPGTYQVLCFEFCGLYHDQMLAKFTVKPNA